MTVVSHDENFIVAYNLKPTLQYVFRLTLKAQLNI